VLTPESRRPSGVLSCTSSILDKTSGEANPAKAQWIMAIAVAEGGIYITGSVEGAPPDQTGASSWDTYLATPITVTASAGE
jgi:hypothetical protein